MTYPLEGSDVTDQMGVTVVCNDGFAVHYDFSGVNSCEDFAGLANVADICQGRLSQLYLTIAYETE